MPTKPTGRPRGRPPGAKNTPSLATFVVESLQTAPPPPPSPVQTEKVYRGQWAGLTPEERSERARAIGAKRNPATRKFAGRKKGVPRCFTAAQWDEHRAAQQPIIARIIKKMADKGQLPEDPRAEEALGEAMMVLRSPVAPRDKLAAARLVLDFTKTKPTTKVEHTVKSAEDILDDMADDDE